MEQRARAAQQQGAPGEQPGGDPGQAVANAPRPAPAKERPGYVRDDEWDAAAGRPTDAFYNRLTDLMARQAKEQASRPGSADGYAEVGLPANFVVPAGLEIHLDQNDPFLKSSRELAFKHGVSRDTYQELLGLHAAMRIAEEQPIQFARNAELAKLNKNGVTGQERIANVGAWLRARVGSKADGLVRQLQAFPHSVYVEALEDLARSFAHRGSQPSTQEAPRAPVPAFDGNNFTSVRAAQDRSNTR
jgi:hypothetical protein